MFTPWGESDSQQTLAPGIVSYSTPSHGGIRLSPERQSQLPDGIDNFVHDLRWWEEDCDWAVPYVLFSEDVRAHGTAYKFNENLAAALVTVKRFHPEILK